MHFKVKAIYEYASPHEDDLSFPEGQVITVTEEEDAEWYVGEYIDAAGNKKEGLFPKNFVERYEPEIPSRPNRASRHKPLETSAPPPEPPVEAAPPPSLPVPAVEQEAPKPPVARVDSPPIVEEESAPAPKPPAQLQQKPPAATKSAPAEPAAKSPPPVAEKPSSFRDRIAAFNKPAAPPIAPFKPSGSVSGNFIKKPFVAPPPSRDAYVPISRDPPPPKVYRREEDTEPAERASQDQDASKRPTIPLPTGTGEEDEDAPKPTSLKERIALLQKQQMEQARRSESVQHKEKPKRPPKKRLDSHDKGDGAVAGTVVADETADIPAIEEQDAAHEPPPPARKPHATDSPNHAVQSFSDANDADQSAAGETTEDAEGTSTSVEDDDVPSKVPRIPVDRPVTAVPPAQESEQEVDSTEEEADEMDAETRRRMELRERMANLSGGMGMAGMFGPPGGMAMPGMGAKKKKPAAPERRPTDGSEEYASPPTQPMQRVALFPVPGMAQPKTPEIPQAEAESYEDEATLPAVSRNTSEDKQDMEDKEESAIPPEADQTPAAPHERPVPPPPPIAERAVPPVPGDRHIPPPESRPAPPPPRAPPPVGDDSDSEDIATERPTPVSNIGSPGHSVVSPPQPPRRSSYFGSEQTSPEILPAPGQSEKRTSRIPPIPSPAIGPPSQTRAPPPPPPNAPLSRQSTMDSVSKRQIISGRDEGETEYEGDYDTDIAPGATHKDALKSHTREHSQDESTTADDTPIKSPSLSSSQFSPPAVPRAVPPPPPSQPPGRQSMDAPRGAPPPPPTSPPHRRQSVDAPRTAPPPPPPVSRPTPALTEEDEYDPYRYPAASRAMPSAPAPPPPRAPPPAGAPPAIPPTAFPPVIPPTGIPPMPLQTQPESSDEEDLYSSPPPRKSIDRAPPPPPQDRPAPPLPPQAVQGYPSPPAIPPSAPPPSGSMPRKSLDANRHLGGLPRKSTDQPRPSIDSGFIANDVDLGYTSQWWSQPNMLPPIFQSRKDLLSSVQESSSSEDGAITICKDVYIIFIDYSQTIITARFSQRDVTNVSLEQRHEPPPPRLRQDQLEDAHAHFGQPISNDVTSKQNSVVADGTPHGLIYELLTPLPSALPPVGTRAYGALVYANIANATVQQSDEIRPGDIISFRNARFQGKHGPMHQKYNVDVGKPDHVGVVVEWDGTKKKVRAWEQGRESKKVKVESFKLGDLRSGEVRVWRVMGKDWVGWEVGY